MLKLWSFTISTLALIALAGVALLTAPVQSPQEQASSAPLQVNVFEARQHDTYTLTHEYVGRVENRQQSRVGFELPGKVLDLYFDDGDTVHKGERLAKLDTQLLQTQLQELQSRKKQSEAELELARLTRDRLEESVQKNAVTKQAYDEAHQTFLARQASLEAITSQINQVKIRLDKSSLYAPYDATVRKRLIDEGHVVQPGEPIYNLIEHNTFEVRVGVSQPSLQAIVDSPTHTLRINGGTYSATIKSVLPVESDSSRTVEVLFQLDSNVPRIRQGNLVVLEVKKQIAQPGFWLPTQALTESSRGLWACYTAIQENGQTVVKRKNLTLIHQSADHAYINGTLQDGDYVVRDGLQRVVPNQPVHLNVVANPKQS